jgi:hypothetical protein
MKKIALISSFCDNQEKLNLLKKNVKTIKSFGVDVMVISPLKLDDETIDICDFLIYTKENPVLNWPEKAYFQWWDGTVDGKHITMTTTYPDYGYAGLLQVKRMSDLALSMDYDIFFPMIYDINIDEHVESIFLDNKKNSFFPSIRDGHIWSIGLHLISLDRDHLFRFKTLITKGSYLVEGDFDAFAWLHRAVKLVPGFIEEKPIEDLIYYLENKDFFNISPDSNFKCFIHKNGQDNVKIVFYDFGGVKNFKIKSNDYYSEFDVREWDEISLPFIDCNNLLVTQDDRLFDFSNEISKITHNEIFIR